MPPPTTTLTAPIGFAPAKTVVADDERPGLLRSPTVGGYAGADAVAFEPCTIRDIDATEDRPGFAEAGFEAVQLPHVPGLLDLLGEVRDNAALAEDQVERLRHLLSGVAVPLADGSRLHIDHVADEGVILRQAGPDRAEVEGADHTAAVNVHIDQDVGGTPLRQLFDGAATEVFRHDAPDSHNHESSQHLVNLWLPLRQITRPLTLMDGRSLDRRRHQLRYRLPVDGFLDREDDQRVNDIWLCLHDPAQEWWFRPDTELGDAYVFDTLSTPHASLVLPGEDVAAARSDLLGAVAEAVRADDLPRARALAADAPASAGRAATVALQAAIDTMDALLERAAASGTEPDDRLDGSWLAAVEAARSAVVRTSIELRAVATRRPAGG